MWNLLVENWVNSQKNQGIEIEKRELFRNQCNFMLETREEDPSKMQGFLKGVNFRNIGNGYRN
jgi:hypothetical protein